MKGINIGWGHTPSPGGCNAKASFIAKQAFEE